MIRRVLMTADAVGGVWTYALDLAEGLAAHGVATTLAVLGPSPSDDQRRDAERRFGLTLVDTGLPLDWTAETPAEIETASLALRDLAGALRPDIIHLNSPALAEIGGFGAPVLGACHSCQATWWAAVRTGPAPADMAWRSGPLRRGMAACDMLIAPSRSFAAAVAREHRVPPPLVVHNGRRAPVQAEPGRRALSVFASGRLWDQGKNVAVLDAAAQLAATPVAIAGPLTGPGSGDLVQLAHAQALGRLSAAEVEAWLAQARIYASSALYEPFGLGVLEAAQAGCALVLSDIPTFRELWAGAAVFVDPRAPQAYADAFDILASDEAQARRLGELARARAARFTVEAMSRRTLDIYRGLGARLEAAE